MSKRASVGKKRSSKSSKRPENRRTSIAELKSTTEFHDGRSDVNKFGAGDSFYIAKFLKSERKELFASILNEAKFAQMFNVGKEHAEPIPRLVCAQSERDANGGCAIYRMPGCNEKNIGTEPFTPRVKYVVDSASKQLGVPFNHCVITRFRTNEDSLSFHYDKLLDLKDKSIILSVSFGDTRPIVFVSADGSTRQTIMLAPGSLLCIGPKTNAQYFHAIPKLSDVVGERISLSIRCIETFIKFDEKDQTGKTFVVYGKGKEFQTPNYPFTTSHDDDSKYSETVKADISHHKAQADAHIKVTAAAAATNTDAACLVANGAVVGAEVAVANMEVAVMDTKPTLLVIAVPIHPSSVDVPSGAPVAAHADAPAHL